MKYLISFILFCSLAFAQTNNIYKNITISPSVASSWYYSGTLTSSIDTAIIFFTPPEKYSGHTLVLYTTSGTDTVIVSVQSLDSLKYSNVAVINKFSTNTTIALDTIPVTTTSKEYSIIGSWKQRVRLISTSKDGSVTNFILGVK